MLHFSYTGFFLWTYLSVVSGWIKLTLLGCAGVEAGGRLDLGPWEQTLISLMSLPRALVHNLGLFVLISFISINCNSTGNDEKRIRFCGSVRDFRSSLKV